MSRAARTGLALASMVHACPPDLVLTLLRFSDITEVYPQGWYGCASSNGRTVPKVVRK